MNHQNAAPGPLNSWKEIADYLGVTVRTAQNWERTAGMPVRRRGGERGRVWADPAELDTWKQRTSASRRRLATRVIGLYAAGVTLLLVALLTWWFWSGRTGPPASFRVEANRLEVLDASGRRLWTRALEHGLNPESYRQPQPLVRFDDVDGDGIKETLFVSVPVQVATHGTVLHCLSSTGEEKWRFVPGRVVSDRQQSYSPIYIIAGFLVLRGRGGQSPRIVVTAHERSRYPNQVAVLDTAGRLTGEYWHSGHLYWIETMDLDFDGTPEILLGGMNNGYRAATLVVLDPRRVSGASVQPPDDHRHLQGFAAGSEKARLLFPRTCINRKIHEYNWVGRLLPTGDTVIVENVERITNQAFGVIYTLDRNLNLAGFEYSDPLRTMHREMSARRELNHELTSRELEEMRKITRLPAEQ